MHFKAVRWVLPGVMHMEADLLDGIGDIGVGERQVLEDISETPKLSRINNRRPRLDRDLDLCIHGCQNYLVVHYAGALKDVKRVLVRPTMRGLRRWNGARW
jgi:hypothetical protein